MGFAVEGSGREWYLPRKCWVCKKQLRSDSTTPESGYICSECKCSCLFLQVLKNITLPNGNATSCTKLDSRFVPESHCGDNCLRRLGTLEIASQDVRFLELGTLCSIFLSPSPSPSALSLIPSTLCWENGLPHIGQVAYWSLHPALISLPLSYRTLAGRMVWGSLWNSYQVTSAYLSQQRASAISPPIQFSYEKWYSYSCTGSLLLLIWPEKKLEQILSMSLYVANH